MRAHSHPRRMGLARLCMGILLLITGGVAHASSAVPPCPEGVGDPQSIPDMGDLSEAETRLMAIVKRGRHVTHCTRNGIIVPPDLGHSTFNMLFGNFIWTPWTGDASVTGQKGTILAHALGFTNLIAIFMGVVIIGYTMMSGVMDTAQEGVVMGKDWDSAWMPIRDLSALALIYPAASMGGGILSVAQIAVIWLIIVGGNMATALWEFVIDQAVSDVRLHGSPSQESIEPMSSLFQSMVCARAWGLDTTRTVVASRVDYSPDIAMSSTFLEVKRTHGHNVYNKKGDDDRQTFKIDKSSLWHAFGQSGGHDISADGVVGIEGMVEPSTWLTGYEDGDRMIEFGPGGKCGSVTLPEMPPDAPAQGGSRSILFRVYINYKAGMPEWEWQIQYDAMQYANEHVWPHVFREMWRAAGCVVGARDCASDEESLTTADAAYLKPILEGVDGYGYNNDYDVLELYDNYREGRAKPEKLSDAKVKYAHASYRIAANRLWRAHSIYVYETFEFMCGAFFNQEFDDQAGACRREAGRDPDWMDYWRRTLSGGGWMAAGMWYFELGRIAGVPEDMWSEMKGSVPMFVRPSEYMELNEEGEAETSFLSKWFGWIFNAAKTEQITKGVLGAERVVELAESPAVAGAMGVRLGPSASPAPKKSSRSSPVASLLGLEKVSEMRVYMLDILEETAGSGNNSTLWVASDDEHEQSVGGLLANPFLTIAAIGETMKSTAVDIWWKGLVATAALGFITGFLADGPYAIFTAIMAGPTGAIMDFVMPMIIALCGLLLAAGATMAYFVPLLPLLVWIMMLGSYILSMCEAVMAAPLAVIMMATPEGKGIAGTQEQTAIQLLATVVMNPTLMVIGFVASITLAGVGFYLLNALYAQTLTTVDGVIKTVFVIVLYVWMIMWVCKWAVGVMYRLPQHLLDWFATGAGKRFGDNIEQEVENFSRAFDTSINKVQMAGMEGFGKQLRKGPGGRGWDKENQAAQAALKPK